MSIPSGSLAFNFSINLVALPQSFQKAFSGGKVYRMQIHSEFTGFPKETPALDEPNMELNEKIIARAFLKIECAQFIHPARHQPAAFFRLHDVRGFSKQSMDGGGISHPVGILLPSPMGRFHHTPPQEVARRWHFPRGGISWTPSAAEFVKKKDSDHDAVRLRRRVR